MSNELKSANSVKTGKKFSKARQELNYSIDQIAEKLVINKDYIIAIEKGNFSRFPSEAFAKAYFQKYKQFLGINPDFPELFDTKKENSFKKIKREIKLPYSWNIKNKQIILIFFFATLAILALIFYKSDPKVTELTNEPNINDLRFIEEVIKINASKKVAVDDLPIDSNLLELKFTNNSWIELYVNDSLVEAQQFRTGDVYVRTVYIPFKIVIGNADSIKGTYNGQVIDFFENTNLLTGVSTVNFNNE